MVDEKVGEFIFCCITISRTVPSVVRRDTEQVHGQRVGVPVGVPASGVQHDGALRGRRAAVQLPSAGQHQPDVQQVCRQVSQPACFHPATQ